MALMAILFVPLAFNLRRDLPWADQAGPPGQQAAERSETGRRSPGVSRSRRAIRLKPGLRPPATNVWLTRTRFNGRFVIYFVIWGFLAWYFRGHSILQDSTRQRGTEQSMERLSAPGMILFAVTITLAAVDLIMSLNPHWYSTMIGVYFFSDAVLSGLVVLTLLALWLQSCGLLRGVMTMEHYHDLGKLTFAFVFFWGYIAFSQYMLIWYANMPEETQFYMPRQIGPGPEFRWP